MNDGNQQIYREKAGLQLCVGRQGGKVQRLVDLGSKLRDRGVYLGVAEDTE